ncbi:hypothetical protein IT570_00655 [Candidatus Sumerlaeota bacterium]|nr:hypothetical protein [Candidatus Sumerlaeota bacterium]
MISEPPTNANRDKPITLNFLACDPQEFAVRVYRRRSEPGSALDAMRREGLRRYSLPVGLGEEEAGRVDFDISFDPMKGFEPFDAAPRTKIQLTIQFLFNLLLKRVQAVLNADEYRTDPKCFRRTIDFVMRDDELGVDQVWLEPFYLSSKQQFGFLMGFHFRNKMDVVSRETLKRSLSLNREGRENTDFYADHLLKCESFLRIYKPKLFPLEVSEFLSLDVQWPSEGLSSRHLESKTYVLGNGKRSTSQFQGLKTSGPFQAPEGASSICFLYRPEDKPLAHDLYFALRGEKYHTFPGMERMFGLKLEKENVKGLAVSGFSIQALQHDLGRLKEEAGSETVLPIVLFPWSRESEDPEGQKAYFRLKHTYLKNRLPTQLVSVEKLKNANTFKWSVANIALAAFGKLGGKPWKVEPRNESCLIVGLGQAHRKDGEGKISKYFAYSVLTDSSGLYETIRVVAHSENRGEYLKTLLDGVLGVLHEHEEAYRTFVIHTPFALRRDELDQVHRALAKFSEGSANGKRLVAMKFNDTDKYLGFALWNNSKTPFESTFVRLGRGEYLVWFEGLQYHNPKVTRRIARPMHVEFTYSNSGLEKDDEVGFLQDAVNLSGANWRGFNAKSAPVSVYYAQLISRYIGHFDQLGLSEIEIENMPPWFL